MRRVRLQTLRDADGREVAYLDYEFPTSLEEYRKLGLTREGETFTEDDFRKWLADTIATLKKRGVTHDLKGEPL